MARNYGKVDCNTWQGLGAMAKLRGNTAAQVLYLYLLTGPLSKGSGIYPIDTHTIAGALGVDEPSIAIAMSNLQSCALVSFDGGTGYVYVHHMAAATYGPALQAHSKGWHQLCKDLLPDASHPFVAQFITDCQEEYELCAHPVFSLYAQRAVAQEALDKPAEEPKPKKKKTPLVFQYADEIDQVWAHWVALHEASKRRGTKPILSDDRKKLLAALLKVGHTVDHLKMAATGIWNSKWHQEKNQIRFDLCYRDSEHVERLARDAEAGSVVVRLPLEGNPYLRGAGWSYTPSTRMYYHKNWATTGWVYEDAALELQRTVDLNGELLVGVAP